MSVHDLYHFSGSLTDSTTFASGYSCSSSSQKPKDGASTAQTKPSLWKYSRKSFRVFWPRKASSQNWTREELPTTFVGWGGGGGDSDSAHDGLLGKERADAGHCSLGASHTAQPRNRRFRVREYGRGFAGMRAGKGNVGSQLSTPPEQDPSLRNRADETLAILSRVRMSDTG